MNAARRAARAGRNLLIALVVGAVIIVAIVVAYMAGRGGGPAGDVPQSAPQANGSTGPTGDETAAAPTGCIAGTSRDNSMLLGSQASASATTFGGVEVAASFFKWTVRSPHPSEADVRGAQAIFVPSDATAATADLIAEYRRNPNPSGGAVADGTNFYLSMVGARWSVAALANGAGQRVSILAPFVINGALSPTKTVAEAFDLRVVDGRWRVVRLAKADPAQLASGGTAFTAGC